MTAPLSSFLALAAQLEGIEVTHLWRGHGSALFLELGTLAPRQRRDGSPGHPEGEVSLGIEWSWRIESANAIACGSWSDEKLWEPTFQLLRNRKVEQLKLFGRLPEVSLSLSGDLPPAVVFNDGGATTVEYRRSPGERSRLVLSPRWPGDPRIIGQGTTAASALSR